MKFDPKYKNLVILPYDFLEEMEPAPGYFYDEKRGKAVIKWIEQNCRLTDSEWEGRPFKLLEWQKIILKKFYGFVKEEKDLDGKPIFIRQFRTLFINVPKKNGKSQLAAALVLYHLLADGEKTPQIFSIAVNLDQSSIIYDDAAKMLELNKPFFKDKMGLETRSNVSIIDKKNNGTYTALTSSGKGTQGYRPSLVVADELHEYANLRVFDSMTGAPASANRRQPVRLFITTAGFDETGITKFYKKKSLDIMEKRTKDPSFLGVVFAAKEFNFDSAEDLAKIVNPSYRCYKQNKKLHLIRPEMIREALDHARMNQRKQEEFMAYILNIEIEKGRIESFIPMKKWRLGILGRQNPTGVPSEYQIDRFNEVFKKNPIVAGFDFGLKSDFAALIEMAFCPEDKKFCIRPSIWVTQPEIKRQEQSNVPVLEWRKKGYFELDIIESFKPHYLGKFLHRKLDGKNIVRLAYDPYWVGTQMKNFAKTVNFPCEPVKTSYGGITEANDVFIRYLESNQLRFMRNDLLDYCAKNTYAQRSDRGYYILDKKDQNRKIDPIVALTYAFDAFLKLEPVNQPIVSPLGTDNKLKKEPMFHKGLKRRRISWRSLR